MSNRRLDALRRLALAVALAVILAMAFGATAGEARQMTVFSCHDPAGNPVGHDGWATNRTGDLNMSLTDTCSGGGQGSLGLELGANVSGFQNAARSEWVFTAPAWASISSYRLQIADSYAIPSTGGGSGQAYVNASDESDPNYDYRNLGAGNVGAYMLSRTPPDPVSSIEVNASCDGQDGPCPAGVAISRIDLSSATLLLNDSSTPTVSGLSGSLVSGATLQGTAEVSFNAADAGPGVYSAGLVLDGRAQPAEILDANSGWCQDLGQTSDGSRSFAHPDSCPQTVSGSLILDTTALSDGEHTVKLLVDDASGNTTIAFNAPITVHNSPAPAAISASISSSSLEAQMGAQPAPIGAGPSARLRLNAPQTITRSFAARAVTVPGRLTDELGRPLANASLDILQSTPAGGSERVIGHAQTRVDGSFIARVPPGPSRHIEIAYRPSAADPTYAAQASIAETVRAGVELTVSPRRTGSTGTITLSGRVFGPIPRGGVVVGVLVHYRGSWEPFRTPRTDANGRFTLVYKFQGAAGRFPFRAQVFGAQSGFPYVSGASGSVDVATG